MQFYKCGSNPNNDFATQMNSAGVGAEISGHRIGSKAVSRSKRPIVIGARPENNPFGVFRTLLASQKLEDFLEGFFAVLAIIYFVAAASFAGVLIGNAFGS
jgi:hypothetical protein